MNTFDWAWQSIRLHKEEISLVLGLLTAVYILYGIGRAGHFIGEVAFASQEGWFPRTVNWLRGIGRALLLSWYAPTLLFAFPRRRFIGARYYTELQILQPRASLPNRRDYNEREYKRRFETARDGEGRRRERIRQLLRERLTEEPGILTAAVLWLLQKLRLIRKDDRPLGPVVIADFPELDDSRTKIKRYFEALERRSLEKGDDATRFPDGGAIRVRLCGTDLPYYGARQSLCRRRWLEPRARQLSQADREGRALWGGAARAALLPIQLLAVVGAKHPTLFL